MKNGRNKEVQGGISQGMEKMGYQTNDRQEIIFLCPKPNERCLVNGSEATSTMPARIPKNIVPTPRPSKDEVIKAHKSRMGKTKP